MPHSPQRLHVVQAAGPVPRLFRGMEAALGLALTLALGGALGVAVNLGALLACGPARAAPRAPAPGMTFAEALAEAYETNPQLLAERRRLRATDENVPQALAGWRPKVSVGVSFGGALFDDNMDTAHDPEKRDPQSYALQIQQPIYTSGQVHARVQQAEAEIRAERASLAATEAEVLLNAGQAYLDVLRDREIVALNNHQVEVQQRTVRASTVELSAGGVSPADLGQARARLATAIGQAAEAAATLHASEAAFERQVGQPPAGLAPATDTPPLPPDRQAAIARAEDANPEVVSARENLDASRHGIDVERAGLLPHIAFNGMLERIKDTDLQKLNQRDNVLEGAVQLTLPLYQGGEEYSRIRQAKETAYRLEDVLADAKRQARQLASVAWDQLQAAKIRVASGRDAIAGNAAAARGYAEQQAVGARTLLDVLVVQQDLLASQVAEVSAEHDLVLARLQLASALGLLDATALQLPAPVFDPAAHYRKVRDKWIGTTPPG